MANLRHRYVSYVDNNKTTFTIIIILVLPDQQAALNKFVRVFAHDLAILACTRLRLVGVDD